jgi:hypothetical protein
MKDLNRPGYTQDEAVQVANEHAQSPDVAEARTVTFAGNTHVHLDLNDGDIVVIDTKGSMHIACK